VVGSLDSSDLGLFLGNALGNEDIVFDLLLLLLLELSALEGAEVTAALEALGGDESLDFGSFGVWLRVGLLLASNLSSHDVLPDVVLLGEVEHFPDLGRPLGTEPLGQNDVCQPGNFFVALLDDDDGEDSNVGADNASADGFAAALTSATDAVARVTIGEEELHSVGQEDTLLHWETLLVISTGDAEDVAFPFVANRVGRNLLGHFLVVEDTVSFLIVEIEEFLGPSCGVGNVELHTCGKSRWSPWTVTYLLRWTMRRGCE